MTVETQKARQAAVTRSQLVSVGRQLFAEHGFAATSTEEIVLRAGVTRGALYYHFRNKQDLFGAVFQQLEEEIGERVSAVAMAESEPWAGLVSGCEAFLDACLDPAVQRIVLIDGPSVLGWRSWKDLGSPHVFGLIVLGLEWAIVAGQLEEQPVVPLAHVLLGALHEGAVFIAQAADRDHARAEVGRILTRLLAGLRIT